MKRGREVIMYKKQMSLQRIVCLLSIIASAVVFIYSLGMMTDLFDMLYNMIPDPEDLDTARVAGARIYYDMQGFNRTLLRGSIGLILLSCLLYLTNTHVRRKYYVGNYVATGLNVAANCFFAFWAHGQIAYYKDSTFWFDIHIAVFALTLIVSLLLIVNVIWKIKVMGDEKRLLQAGKAVSA